MFTWTHIGERRFDWRAFRLQNKILLFFFFYLFNHQNVNSKCNNDAQVWEALVWISTLEKKKPNIQQVYFQTSSGGRESRRGQAHKTRLVFPFAELCTDPDSAPIDGFDK